MSMKKAKIPGLDARYLYDRDGYFYFRQSIPDPFRSLANGLTEFKVSLRTTDPEIAKVRYLDELQEHKRKLDKLRSGQKLEQLNRYPVVELERIAQKSGVSYKPLDQLQNNFQLQDALSRLKKLDALGFNDPKARAAILGVGNSTETLRDVFDWYIDHQQDQFLHFDPREKAKRIKPILLAISKFEEFMGGQVQVRDLRKKDVNSYRIYLIDKIKNLEIGANTANKYLTNVRKILNLYIHQTESELGNPFSGVAISETPISRPPFSLTFLNDVWGKENAFQNLNPQCVGILKAMINTGCGPKELIFLEAEDIVLDHEFPHIKVRHKPNQLLKQPHRGRDIPLVGVSLDALRNFQNGFPQYRRINGSEAFSGLAMKYLKSNKMLESSRHGTYSLRHAFKDRMRQHDFPLELQNYLMGHKQSGMGASYGAGYSIKKSTKFMKKIAKDIKFC